MNSARLGPDNFRRRALLLLVMAGMWLPTEAGLAQSQSNAVPELSVVPGSRVVRAHDPSTIVKCNGEYWGFYTGRGIPSCHSRDLTNWEAGPRVFTNAPDWVAEAVPENRWMHFWAPDVIQLDDRYLLYYSVSTFGKNRSAIGLATNPTLDPQDPRFHWTDEGIVVQSADTNNYNAIDPAVCRDAEGKLWLAFGSYWTGIKLIQLDPHSGKRLTNSALDSLAFNDSIEAAYIHRHDGFYYLFVNWGRCCVGTNSTYEIRVGRSKQITGPYLDQGGVGMITGGGTPFLRTSGPFIGPGHAGIVATADGDWLSCHFYDGTRRGMPTLALFPLHWDTNGWPEIKIKASPSK